MSRLLLRIDRTVPQRFRGFRPRAAFVIGLLALGGLVLAGRAYDLQVLQHERLKGIAQRQSQRTIAIKGRRGDIRDRDNLPLAISVRGYSFFAHPARIAHPAQAAFRLAQALGVDGESLEEKLRGGKGFAWIKRHATPREAAAVKALAIQGVGATQEYSRVYPGRLLSGPLLGFTGVDNQGLEGLEYAYDSFLKGAEGYQVVDHDALGRSLLNEPDHFPTGGGSLRLSLDSTIQHITQREVARAVERYEARQGIGVVLHAQTGEILAMAHAPALNPNDYQRYDKETYFNRAVTSGYEPGSTMKVLTAAVALEEGLVKPDTLFYCEQGEWEHYDSVIHDTTPHGWLGLAGVIRVSSNICAAKMGLMLPAGVFREYLARFGLGSRLGLFTGPDGQRLAGEAEGYLLPQEKWTPVDHAAIAFGHGVLVSPLQMANAINAIATGGLLLKPRLVLEVRDAHGEIVAQNYRQVVRRVVSGNTARTVTRLMRGVVEKEGTGQRAAVPGHAVAGKTGTTEVYDIQARGYSKTKHIASFVGFVPADKPVLTILVQIEAPRTGRYGGVVAAPVFSKIAREALPLLGVWPAAGIKRMGLAKSEE